ncbi:spermatogenesis- and oogenesis-specific basic helix-loop-helix-containing protein 1-like isoform X2 [Ailuropoda melanoleuca]|uniref:spermatogenesis- and oogenesis-specific basic helix-loop-helix-containing protein 1-like isoform X2 n=1 Tax=Ailuropoda melanoleuca TaxID=9646 RepID=UPI0014941594|nr:spermatogenesis- and oogenesis-specific basic helix-loop-helix-containing protein 1-like isoform X2 [Ailuropoda melanoleuca]
MAGGGQGLQRRTAPHVGKADLHLTSVVEPCSLLSRPPGPSSSKTLRPPPPWPPRLWQPPSPLVSEEAQSCLDQAGPPAEGASSVETLDTRWVPRPVSGCDVEDGTSFLLNTSPDWWLGSLEGRGASAPSRSTAKSSLLDRAEPGFLTDPEPGSQELPDGPLEPWGSDASCPSLAREDVDSIFPDFFPC